MTAENPRPVEADGHSSAQFARAFRWAMTTAWSCSRPLSGGLVSSSVLASMIPALSTLAIGVLIKRLTEQQPDSIEFALWLVIVIALLLAGTLLEEAQRFFQHRLTDEMDLSVRQHIYRHASRLDLAFFENRQDLDTLFRAKSGAVRGLLGPVQFTISGSSGALQAASLFAVMAWYEPVASIVLALAALPMLLVQWVIAQQKYRLDVETTRSRRWGNYFTQLLTDPNTVPTIRMFRLEGMLLGQMRRELGSVVERRSVLHRRKLMLVTLSSGMFFSVLIGVMVWLNHQMSTGAVTASELSIFGLAAFRARDAVWRVVNAVSGSVDSVFVVNHLLDFLDTRSTITPGTKDRDKPFAGELRLESVTFRYPGTGLDAVRDLSLHVPAGQTVAIVGQNGAGKSTLMKLICRLYDPNDGRVLLDGVDLRDFSHDYLNAHFSLVQQWPIRFEATVRDIIALGNRERFEADPAALDAYLERLPGMSFIDRLPDGLDTQVGRHFGEITLSHGQWQQVSIARAMARESSIVILDEPMASLDAVAERELFDWVSELGRARTIILVSHRFSTVQKADRIVVLGEGRVVEDGSHDTLLSAGGVYATMFNAYYGLEGEAG